MNARPSPDEQRDAEAQREPQQDQREPSITDRIFRYLERISR